MPGSTEHERFLIGHELGHYFLEKYFQVSPLGDAEYWQHEEVCNHFARVLLVPEALLDAEFGSTNISPRLLLKKTAKIAACTKVSWRTAAYRVSQYVDGALLFGIKMNGANFRIKFSPLPARKEIGRKISRESSVGQQLSTTWKTRKPVDFAQEEFKDGGIPACSFATAGTAFRSSKRNVIFLAVTLGPAAEDVKG